MNATRALEAPPAAAIPGFRGRRLLCALLLACLSVLPVSVLPVSVLPVPAVAQTPAARDQASLRAPYGVLAYSREADRWGRSWGYAFSNLAISRAVRECGRPDCEAVLLLSGDCGAIASGPSSYGFGRGPTVAAALATAMRMCASQRARGCRPLVTVCAAGLDRP